MFERMMKGIFMIDINFMSNQVMMVLHPYRNAGV